MNDENQPNHAGRSSDSHRRPYQGGSNRPPRGRGGPPRGGGGGRGPRRGGGGGKPGPPDYPMLLGEPSPALAKIATMNTEKLEAKIASLDQELDHVTAKLGRLASQSDPPTQKIETAKMLIQRLNAIKDVATERLAEKRRRKAEWEARQQR